MADKEQIILVGWGDLSGNDLDFIERIIIAWKYDGKPEAGGHKCLFKGSCVNGCSIDKIKYGSENRNLCNAILESRITLNEVLELVEDERERRR